MMNKNIMGCCGFMNRATPPNYSEAIGLYLLINVK